MLYSMKQFLENLSIDCVIINNKNFLSLQRIPCKCFISIFLSNILRSRSLISKLCITSSFELILPDCIHLSVSLFSLSNLHMHGFLTDFSTSLIGCALCVCLVDVTDLFFYVHFWKICTKCLIWISTALQKSLQRLQQRLCIASFLLYICIEFAFR